MRDKILGKLVVYHMTTPRDRQAVAAWLRERAELIERGGPLISTEKYSAFLHMIGED